MDKRKIIRLKNYDYSSPGAYFVTVCTQNRGKYLWHGNIDLHKYGWEWVGANCVRPKNLPLSDYGKVVSGELETWNTAYGNVAIHSYIIMPDHIHIMVLIYGDATGRTQFAPTIGRMIKQFKGAVTKKIGHSIWQKSFMEHIVRDRTDFGVRLRYMYDNPIKQYYSNKKY